jgi:hypothetical protein
VISDIVDVQSPAIRAAGGRLAEGLRASRILERGTGMCLQKAVLLCALARTAGIRARLAFQAIRDHRLPRDLVRLMGPRRSRSRRPWRM